MGSRTPVFRMVAALDVVTAPLALLVLKPPRGRRVIRSGAARAPARSA